MSVRTRLGGCRHCGGLHLVSNAFEVIMARSPITTEPTTGRDVHAAVQVWFMTAGKDSEAPRRAGPWDPTYAGYTVTAR